jgi:hypothetical protein
MGAEPALAPGGESLGVLLSGCGGSPCSGPLRAVRRWCVCQCCGQSRGCLDPHPGDLPAWPQAGSPTRSAEVNPEAGWRCFLP